MANAPSEVALPDEAVAGDDAMAREQRPPDASLPDASRLANMLQRLSEIAGDGQAAVTRLAYSPAERDAHATVARWMSDAGLSVRTDAVGNTYGTRPGRQRDLPPIGVGSHLDSVLQGGRFDGTVGVVAGLEVVRLLEAAGIVTEHPIRVIAFAAEEGARFGEACLGSKAVAGLLQPGELGIDPRELPAARWAPGELAALLELHIEQGRLLERDGKAIGLVEAVAGNTRLRLVVHGRADHSGGAPMLFRKDALAAASEIVLGVEHLANAPHRRTTVATVGRLDVTPNSITTVPARVTFFVDVRDIDGDRQRTTAEDVLILAQQVAARRGVRLEAELIGDSSPVVLPLWLRHITRDVCQRLEVPYRVLNSGAGHDAAILARAIPAAMLFVPSHDGLSHCPEEWTSISDVGVGARVLYHSVLALDRALVAQAA